MADKEICVQVVKFGVMDAFDDKYKASLPKIMLDTVEKALKGAGFSTSQSKDKKEKGFYLDGNLNSLEKIEKGKEVTLKATVKMQLATWPDKSMFAFPSATSKYPAGNPAKIDKDVQTLVSEMIAALIKEKVVAAIEAKT